MFADESGFMLQPLRRRTWAPRGETPLQYAWDRHDRLSVISALSLSPRQHRIGLYFRVCSHNIQAPDFKAFVLDVHRQLRRKIILICDRYSVHRKAVRQLKDEGHDWLTVEWLPGYAPDLNPVEAIWNHTKYSDLANFIPNDIDHLFDSVADSLDDQCFNASLKRSFFRSAQLDL